MELIGQIELQARIAVLVEENGIDIDARTASTISAESGCMSKVP